MVEASSSHTSAEVDPPTHTRENPVSAHQIYIEAIKLLETYPEISSIQEAISMAGRRFVLKSAESSNK